MTMAPIKNAAEALVNHARTAAMPARIAHARCFSARAYAAHAITTNAVIVDSISAARFHMTKT